MYLSGALRLVLAATLASFGLVAVGSGPAVAEGACQRTVSSGTIDMPVPERGTVVSELEVPQDGLVVADVDVAVNIHHNSPVQLALTVASFDGGVVPRANSTLIVREPHGSDDILGTVFDDSATTPISWGEAPFTGRFIPDRPLAALNGFTGGSYVLAVDDDVVGVEGTLNDWALTFTYRSCDFDADGVEDHADQCLDLTARTATGCPVTSRAVTAQYKAGSFRGALSSPVAGCAAGRDVSVFRKRPGPDRRVGTATTRADGSFRVVRPKKRGHYYATSLPVVVADAAECPAVQSSTFRIR